MGSSWGDRCRSPPASGPVSRGAQPRAAGGERWDRDRPAASHAHPDTAHARKGTFAPRGEQIDELGTNGSSAARDDVRGDDPQVPAAGGGGSLPGRTARAALV